MPPQKPEAKGAGPARAPAEPPARPAPAGAPPAEGAEHRASVQMSQLLQTVVNMNASDLHLCVGRPPLVRTHGALQDLDTKPLGPEDTLALMKSITSSRAQRELQEKGSCDFGFAFGDAARFRVNVFRQKGNYSIALRLIPSLKSLRYTIPFQEPSRGFRTVASFGPAFSPCSGLRTVFPLTS